MAPGSRSWPCASRHRRPRRSPSSTSPPARPRIVAGADSMDVGRALAAGRLAALRLGCRRLVPGRPADRRRPRPDRADRRESASTASRAAASATRRSRRPTAAGSSTSRSTTGSRTCVVGELGAGAAPKRGRGRPPKTPRTVAAAAARPAAGSTRGTASGGPSAGWPTAPGSRRSARARRHPQDLWLLPVPGVAPADARPRQVTDSLPAVLRRGPRAGPRRRPPSGSPCTARDGLRIEGTLWRPSRRPASAAARGSRRSSTRTAARLARRSASFIAVQAAARGRGVRGPRRRLPRLDRLRPGVPPWPTTASGATPTSTT